MDTNKLNEKLASFAGFKIPINKFDNKPFPHSKYSADLWENPNGEIIRELPDLVNNLNNQEKWIYPKLKALDCEVHKEFKKDWWNVKLSHEYFYHGYAEYEALAFALAVEKLIDSLNKDKR